MKIAGIVCEYNPFHLGHRVQIDKIRMEFGQDTAIIGVMSGHFVQRGEPACMDAYTRAAIAVRCGVDLVLSLPAERPFPLPRALPQQVWRSWTGSAAWMF